MVDSVIEPIDAIAARNRGPEEASAANPESQAERYGTPFLEFVGDHEPDDNPADVFDVHGLIVKGEPGLIVGVPKVGKTMLVEDLVLHIASGRRQWCGVPIYHRCRVLLFLREDSERTTRRRLWQLARGAGISHQELAEHLVIDVKSPLYFDDATHTRKLERQLRDFDICMIDSMSTIHNADENSVERMAPIMNCWRDMSLKTETSIPLIHHFRKSGDGARGATAGSGGILQRARGSSVIGATTRHAVGVEAGSAKHEIVISVESNHEIDTDPFVIKRIFGEDNDGRKWIRHKLVGSMQDARSSHEAALVDPIVLEVIRGAGSEGITATELRRRAIQRIKEHRGRGIRPAVIDGAARRLHEAGSIERRVDGRWRVLGVSGGAEKSTLTDTGTYAIESEGPINVAGHRIVESSQCDGATCPPCPEVSGGKEHARRPACPPPKSGGRDISQPEASEPDSSETEIRREL